MSKKPITFLILAMFISVPLFLVYPILNPQAFSGDMPITAEEPEQVVKPEPQEEEMTFCTMDAKQCPDGSFVGREGADCEFRPCPSEREKTPEKQSR